MILELDIGNSNAKWRLRDGNNIQDSGSLAHASPLHSSLANGKINYDALFESIKIIPQRINAVTVIREEALRFSEWCVGRWGVRPGFAEVTSECEGLVNGYRDISQMGPDRWLAMVAAYKGVHHDCLVIDSGSACTLDLILADGRHLGGYIVPGIELMKDALFRDTDRVKLSSINYDDVPSVGRDTVQAVSSGLRLMLMSLAIVALDQLLAAGAKAPFVLIAGGGAEGMADALKEYLLDRGRSNDVSAILLRPDLVFEGLSVVL